MTLHLLYAKGNEELLNRQSALGSYMACLCKALQKNNITIYVNGILYDDLKRSASTSITVNPIGKGRFFWVPSFIKNALKDFKKLKSIRSLKEKIMRASVAPDVFLEFYNYGSDLGYSLSEKLNKPLLLVYDAPVMEEFEFFNGKNIVYRNEILKRERKSLQAASKIVVYSNAVKDFLIRNYHLNNNQFAIHQNVDFTRFEFQAPKTYSEAPVIGFIGSFLKWHRVDLLIDAYEFIRQKGIYAKLILAGSGAEWNNIQERCKISTYKNDILVMGFLDGKALQEVKESMHIGVMPGSNWYGAPNKIFEYGAAGLAVVAPNTPTICSLFDHENELALFKWDDLKALCRALEEVLTNRELYNRISQNLHQKIKSNYSEENTRHFYSELFNQIVK